MTTKLAQLEALVEKLEDALQVSTLTIEQNESDRWPAYDASWKAETINVVEGRVEPRLPSYMNKLGNNCRYLVVLRTFGRYREMGGPRYSDNGIAYGNPPDLYQARWGRTRLPAPPPVPRTPNPNAHLERRNALATGRQVPLKR